MSINIQLEGGLKKLSGQTMSKEKIIDKLGYTPADAQIVDANIVKIEADLAEHVDSTPDIFDDESGSLEIADPSGNVIAKVDEDGLHTTNVEAESLTSNDNDLLIADDSGNVIFKVDENGAHTTKLELTSGDLDSQLNAINAAIEGHSNKLDGEDGTPVHILPEERERWDNKSDFSGNYSDLVNAPDIAEDEAGDLVVADDSGNIIFKVDEEGAHTTKLSLASGDLDTQLRIINADLASHASDSTVHVTPEDRQKWDNKSDFSGNYEDLKNVPDIQEDASNELTVVDTEGRIVLRVDEAGVQTTKLKLDSGDIDEQLNVLRAADEAQGAALDKHAKEATHITPAEREDWNKKATTGYVDQKITDLVNAAPETLDTLGELAAALGEDKNFSATVAAKIASLETHTEDSVAHITATERETWNNKSDFSGKYEDLTGAPSILEDEDNSDEFVIIDDAERIAMRVTADGVVETARINTQDLFSRQADVVRLNAQEVYLADDEEGISTKLANCELKTDANQKFAEAKEYADELVEIDEISVELGAGGSIGGYRTGDIIAAGTDIKTILNKLFQKAVPATYNSPTLTLTSVSSPVGNFEYGTEFPAQLSAIFVQHDAGALESISISKKVGNGSYTVITEGYESPLTSDEEIITLTDTVTYKASAAYAEGPIKNNNLGEPSPDGHIEVGTVASSELKFTPYRCGYFYGVLDTDSSIALTSDIIRSGSKKAGAYAKGNLPLISASSVANRKRIFVACPATNTGVTKVIMPSSMNADCTADFKKQASTVTVKGANGSTGIAYNVWVYEPAEISDDQTFTVTLG